MQTPQPHEEQELNKAPYKYRVSHKTKGLFFVLFILGLAAYFYMVYERRALQKSLVLENHMAAVTWNKTPLEAFMVTEPLSNKKSLLSSHLGQWTLLNLWATWCPSCREEMPSLELLHQKLGFKLKVLALSLDDNNQAVIDFININKPSFPVLIDQEKISQKLLGIDKYPETFLISPEGMIVLQFSGPRQWASNEAINYLEERIR